MVIASRQRGLSGVLHEFAHVDAQFVGNTLAVVPIDAEEMAELTHLHFPAGLAEYPGDAGGEPVTMSISEEGVELADLRGAIVIYGGGVT